MPSLCASSSHKSNGSTMSWLDPKEVPQMKGDVTPIEEARECVM
jgi:hypothetical protein